MATNTKAAAQAEETVQAEAGKKTYKLRSANKFLTVAALGVQFMSGKYETTDPQVARALMTLEGVDLDD